MMLSKWMWREEMVWIEKTDNTWFWCGGSDQQLHYVDAGTWQEQSLGIALRAEVGEEVMEAEASTTGRGGDSTETNFRSRCEFWTTHVQTQARLDTTKG